MESVIIAFR